MADILTENKKEKKRREKKRLRENSSQTEGSEDEIGTENAHHTSCKSCDSRLSHIEEKLDLLLAIMPELDHIKSRINNLEDENKNFKKSLEHVQAETEELQEDRESTRDRLRSIEQGMQNLNSEILGLRSANIRLEAYTRRENIKLFNVQETPKETNAQTETLVRNVFMEKMKLRPGDVDAIKFERVHRIPTKSSKALDNTRPRPIIAKFSFFKDKEKVMSAVRNLKGTKIGIADDYPKEIDHIHKTLYPVLREAKKNNQAATFKVDKLIINGQIYRGPETYTLPFYNSIMRGSKFESFGR